MLLIGVWGYELETSPSNLLRYISWLLTEKEPLDFPLLLFPSLLLFALHLLIQARECFLVCFALVIKLSKLIFDGIEVNMSCKHKFILFIYFFIYLFKFFLELLNVFLCMRAHLLEYRFGPLKRVNLIFCPVGWSWFELYLRLNDVELLLQLFQLLVVDLNKVSKGTRLYIREWDLHGRVRLTKTAGSSTQLAPFERSLGSKYSSPPCP